MAGTIGAPDQVPQGRLIADSTRGAGLPLCWSVLRWPRASVVPTGLPIGGASCPATCVAGDSSALPAGADPVRSAERFTTAVVVLDGGREPRCGNWIAEGKEGSIFLDSRLAPRISAGRLRLGELGSQEVESQESGGKMPKDEPGVSLGFSGFTAMGNRRSIRFLLLVCVMSAAELFFSVPPLHAQSSGWTVLLTSGFEYSDVMIFDVRQDSIFLYFAGSPHGVSVDSVHELRRSRGSYLGEGIGIGFLGGAMLGALFTPADWGRGGHGFAVESPRIISAAGLGLAGSAIGGLCGAFVNKVEVHVLSGMDPENRLALLRDLLFELPTRSR